MKTLSGVAEFNAFRQGLKQSSLGFVPTMGALHDGHLSLVRQSTADNEHTVVSLFVNPTQFDRADDLKAYPRDQARDLALLQTHGVDAVFLPAEDELYADQYRYRVMESELSKTLCGAHRPGHFDGVLTVVMKLLNIVRADRAYFGSKDYQQLQLVRGMADAFFLSTRIVGCPIVREADGLAMSSRNLRLTPAQRQQAPALYRIIRQADSASQAREQLQYHGFAVDYVEDLDGRRLAAASLGNVRLIDNVPIG